MAFPAGKTIYIFHLAGLSAYKAKQRIKEIGVSKVPGATVSNIVFILLSSLLSPLRE